MSADVVRFDELIERLQADPRRVIDRYCSGVGAYREGPRWFCLDPGRDDRNVGSFYVGLTGAYAGRWRDEATGDMGDMLDLIQRATRRDRRGAIEEARALLGCVEETDAERVARRKRDDEARRRREEDAAQEAERRKRATAAAYRMFLAAEERLRDTPVAEYLAGRAIDLARLGRQPRALRYAPRCAYQHTDRETGEIIEGEFPAMVAAIVAGDGRFIGVHRTYLDRRPGGGFGKADVPAVKKVLGAVKGGSIRIGKARGPKGGRVPLARCAPGARVYVTDGIEDALSVAILAPDEYVVSAVALSNMAHVELPAAVAEVVICADNESDPRAAAKIDDIAAAHVLKGRRVRVWRNVWGGKDANDALRLACSTSRGDAA